MSKPLSKRVALVTGANRGIGRATALALAKTGASVAVADIVEPTDAVEAITKEGGHGIAFQVDVAQEDSVLQAFNAISQSFPALDILVHCAGILHEKPLLETAAADFDRVIAVNLRGTFLVGREAIRMMVRRGGGRVILMASDLGYVGRETFSSYVASKHGVIGLTRSWAVEFAPGILVNAICPGPIDTAMLDSEHMSAEWRERELDIPLRRFGRAEEVANMAIYLAGPAAGFITGQGLGVNGGSVMA